MTESLFPDTNVVVLLFDTETTGAEIPEIIEAAWVQLDNPENLTVLDSFEQRYQPDMPIRLGALATHHIYDEELADCPPSASFRLPDDVAYLIGHNVDYDWQAAGSPDVRRICTLALARHIYPDLDSHSQSALLYHTHRVQAREWLKHAHSAMADVRNCRHNLQALLAHCPNVQTWEDLWKLSEIARIPTRMPFGKHRGQPIADVPADYKSWLLRQDDVDPYLVKALRGT
ncbi:MAG TPA: DUF3820 family protein [Burkholderiaceae bacterium]|nr:DUF3820 family protein [Burkholderiaceae bacterium]